MTDQELIKRFYEDIATHKEDNWFQRLFEFSGNVATCREFFEVLPEPIRSYAMEETRQQRLDDKIHVDNVFNRIGTWSEMPHGYIWRRLHDLINKHLYGEKMVDKVRVDELLTLPTVMDW